MVKMRLFLLGSLWVVALFSCEKKPEDYPIEPMISYQSSTAKTINLGDTAAFIRIELKFTDGDGDIGRDATQATNAIFLKDTRDTSSAPYNHTYPFPYIAPELRPSKGGLEGGITINLGPQYFNLDSLHNVLGRDTLQWKIYIMDEAGHKSNTITTDTIYIQK